VNPNLEKKTHMRKNILVENKVTMALAQLNTGILCKCVKRSMALQKV
jgi:hypothetical protein